PAPGFDVTPPDVFDLLLGTTEGRRRVLRLSRGCRCRCRLTAAAQAVRDLIDVGWRGALAHLNALRLSVDRELDGGHGSRQDAPGVPAARRGAPGHTARLTRAARWRH